MNFSCVWMAVSQKDFSFYQESDFNKYAIRPDLLCSARQASRFSSYRFCCVSLPRPQLKVGENYSKLLNKIVKIDKQFANLDV